MVEVDSEIVEWTVSVLIDHVSTHNYVTPRIVEMYALKKTKHRKSWLVQIATGTKRKVSEAVEKCPLVMNGLVTCVDLNVPHLVPMIFSLEWIGWKDIELNLYVAPKILNALMKKETKGL